MEIQVLLPVDDSKRSKEAAAIVGRLLKDHQDCRICLMHCGQHLAAVYQEELYHIESAGKLIAQTQEKRGKEVLQECRRAVLDSGFPADRLELKLKPDSEDPAQDILDEAAKERYWTIAIGRRGRSKVETLLLGSVSSKIAQYAKHRAVWVIDSEVSWSQKVLIGIEDHPDAVKLVRYAAEAFAPIPGLQFTLLHLMPAQPPTLWDDGHILSAEEQKQRAAERERWRTEWVQRVEGYLAEGRELLVNKGVNPNNIETRISIVVQGIAQDLLNDVERNNYQIVLVGKKSFKETKPFNLGSHANKVLFSVKRNILCLLDPRPTRRIPATF